uniref:DDE Tnp4 domain-containing protein n=1 Tax=Oryza sativa subsp. japonica TaxID=39947 RepID=Q6YTZ7_ORYSJ|nr:hypothetical protein [Oryza sativa Japonica Group]BAD17730.1 hypothetical protein [Oryza sativa Japonica Group]
MAGLQPADHSSSEEDDAIIGLLDRSVYDQRILNEAVQHYPHDFPQIPYGRYLFVDFGFPSRMGFLAPYHMYGNTGIDWDEEERRHSKDEKSTSTIVTPLCEEGYC